ncbi:MAG: 30S ribosomal protein S4e [Candidatus Aramenus sp.]|nr:30S ribosomal protein S4e [Candidatus Aramenus sp.]
MVHVTRYSAPWFLRISKKEYKWTVRVSPGPHSLQASIPLSLFLRDYLKVAINLREAKNIISAGKVLVDGRVRRNYRYPVGLMDVVSIPSADLYFRIVPDNARYMRAVQVQKEEAGFKLARVLDKRIVKGGNIQLNLDGGRNIQLAKDKASEYKFPTLTTLKIAIPNQEVLGYYEVKEGNYAVIIGGKNVGRHGTIAKIQKATYKTRRYSIVTIQTKDGNTYETNLENIMVIGNEQPEIKVD